MYGRGKFEYDTILEEPAPIFMGPLPQSWSDVPAPVVVNLCGVFPFGPPGDHTIFTLALHDVQEQDALPERSAFEAFLGCVHAEVQNRGSYWHCHAVLNRSGLALGAYLCIHRGMRVSEAIGLLRTRRSPVVLCNSLFEETLRRWYGDETEQGFEPVDIDRWLVERTGGQKGWR